MFDATQLIKDQSRDASERMPFDQLCQDVAELLLPRDARFTVKATPGMRDRTLYDDYGIHALDAGTTVFTGFVMPRGTRWQLLETYDAELMKIPRVAAWYEAKTQLLFQRRNEAESGYVQQTDMSVARLLAFGNQSMWTDVRRDARGNPVGLSYRSEPLHCITVSENFEGRVDGSSAVYKLTARQAVQRWGREKLVRAPKVLEAASDPKRAEMEMEFLHVLRPNPDIQPGRGDWRGKSHVSLYISMADKEIFEEMGYDASPRTYSRLKKSPGEKYGRGRGIDALPTLNAIQAQFVNIMVASELTGRPALAVADDNLLGALRYGPSEITVGAIGPRGERLVQTLIEGIDTVGMERVLEQLYRRLDKYFYVDMLMRGQEVKTHITAYEWQERNVEKGMLLAPLAQQETEWFSPQLPREIACMDMLGDFDDMPGEVEEAGGLFTVRYANPLTRALEAEGAAGYFRTVEQMTPLWQTKPEALDAFMQEFPIERVAVELARINGAPSAWRASDEERAEKQEEAAQAKQLEQLTAVLPALGKAANDLSGAGMDDAGIMAGV
jgi:hypothetical protein